MVDIVAYDDASIIDALYLDKLRAGDARRVGRPPAALPAAARGRDGTRRGAATTSRSSCRGSPTAAAVGGPTATSTRRRSGGGDFLDSLVKIDVDDGAAAQLGRGGLLRRGAGLRGGAGRDAEDDGVVLSVVLDAAAERSFLLVLDARSFEELARAEAPHRIPFGFHGDFARREA